MCICRQCLEKENDRLQRNFVANIWNKYFAAILCNFLPALIMNIIQKKRNDNTKNTHLKLSEVAKNPTPLFEDYVVKYCHM